MLTVTVNGISAYVAETGEGAPVVLLHSGAGQARDWRRLIAELPAGQRCTALDFHGCGGTPPWPGVWPASRQRRVLRRKKTVNARSRQGLAKHNMLTSGAQALIVAGSLSAAAAVAHLACILIGAPAYRFMGAGEKMVRAAEAGRLQPALITLAIACVLFIWAAYAFAGAGVIGRLPLLKLALTVICAAYLGRAVAFPLLKRAFPENSQTFWLVSSGICLGIGLVHVYGITSQWPAL